MCAPFVVMIVFGRWKNPKEFNPKNDFKLLPSLIIKMADKALMLFRKRGDNPDFPSNPGKQIPSREQVFSQIAKTKEFPSKAWYDTTKTE